MSGDTTGQEAFAAAMSGAPEPASPDTTPPAPSTPPEPAAPQAAPSGEPSSAASPQAGNDGMVPSWRLRELSEERARYAREVQNLRRWREEREAADRKKAEEETAKSAGFDWANPDETLAQREARLQAGIKQSLVDPVQQQMRQMTEFQSRQMAILQASASGANGAQKVQEAYTAFSQALQSGDPEAAALYQRMISPQNLHPFGDIMAWQQRRSVLSEVGSDPAAYRERVMTDALKDPAFLQRAMEAARSQATPVVTGDPRKTPVPAIPSLNRTTSASDAGAEEDDPQAVFRTAQRAGSRRGSG